ncbi:MAG: SPFH domain-containing protein [Chitinophagaceae bacterium]
MVSAYVRNYTVENYEKALLFVDGQFKQIIDAGVYDAWWKNNIAVTIGKVDMRQQQIEINGQEILTKDKAALTHQCFCLQYNSQ